MRHHRGVVARQAPGMQHGAVLGGHVDGVDDVLQADRHAVQRPDGAALAPVGVAGAGLGQRMGLVQVLPGLHLALGLADALQAGLHQLLGVEQPVADALRRVARGQPFELASSRQRPYRALGSHSAMPGKM